MLSRHQILRAAIVGLIVGLFGSAPGWVTAQQTGPRQYMQSGPVRQVSNRYMPAHMRQDTGVPQTNGQAAPTRPEEITGQPAPQTIQDWGDGAMMDDGYVEGYPDDSYFDEEYVEGGCDMCGGCDGGCGIGCDCPVDPRDCGIAEDCWLRGLGGILYNGDYFAGAQGFRHPVDNEAFEDQNCFGFNAGANFGLPLYCLTCGLVSGQAGFNVVNSNYTGGPFDANARDQVFSTVGLFRRVDYGLQLGAVADHLRDEWYVETELVQIRSQVSWVFAAGHELGVRNATNVQDTVVPIGTDGSSVSASTIDYYRFFYRHAAACGGYSEFFGGWTEQEHGVFGIDYDVAVNDCWALRAGFTYLIPENDSDSEFSHEDDAWNVSVALSWRPRGRCWYEWYHRPLLPAADNGSMISDHRLIPTPVD